MGYTLCESEKIDRFNVYILRNSNVWILKNVSAFSRIFLDFVYLFISEILELLFIFKFRI